MLTEQPKIQKIIALILWNVLLTFLLMASLEIGLRIFRPEKLTYARTYPGQYKNKEVHLDTNLVNVTWPAYENDLGWVCRNSKHISFSNKKYKDLKIEYQINNQGFRSNKNYDTSRAQRDSIRVMLLGDSFVFGVYLGEESTISSVMEKKLGSRYTVYNMGMPGWGIDQMYLTYKKYQPILNPHIVCLMFIDEDIPRVLEAYRSVEGMNKPSFEYRNDKLILRPPVMEPPGTIIKVLEHSRILNPFYRRYLKFKSSIIVEKIFTDLIVNVKANNQNLIVIRCPRKENLLQMEKLENHDFIQLLKDAPVFYYEAYDDMKKLPTQIIENLYIKDDGHLSYEGTEYIAEKISRIVLNLSAAKLSMK